MRGSSAASNAGGFWTADKVAQLRTLWSATPELSATDIAAQLGTVKNAVVGKAHRIGLPSRVSPLPADYVRPEARRRSAIQPRGVSPLAVIPDRPPVSSQPAPAPAPTAPAAAQRAEPRPAGRACRWPLWGDEPPTHQYCGAPARDAACPYCREHAAQAFNSPRTRETAHAA